MFGPYLLFAFFQFILPFGLQQISGYWTARPPIFMDTVALWMQGREKLLTTYTPNTHLHSTLVQRFRPHRRLRFISRICCSATARRHLSIWFRWTLASSVIHSIHRTFSKINHITNATKKWINHQSREVPPTIWWINQPQSKSEKLHNTHV